jgi:hypothetical protein
MASMGCEMYENSVKTNYPVNVMIFDHRGGRAVCFNNTVSGAVWAGINVREEGIDISTPPAYASDGQPQHVSDSYYWNNTINGKRADPAIPGGYYVWWPTYQAGGHVDYSKGQYFAGILYGPQAPYRDVPQFNLDCWKQVDSFDGTSGMGVGPLAARPTSGVSGVGYWATDAKTLYRWSSNIGWEEYYKPYTYPHPMRILE